MRKHHLIYLFLIVSFFAKAQFNYGHQMDFGKNRIQYQNFIWTYFDFERYRIYFYQGGGEISRYTSVSVAKQLPLLEKRLDYQVDDKINIIVYNNQGDFKQSNLGLSSDDQNNIGGVTKIIGDKISVFFNGSHADLDQQIRAALAELLITKILYGGNVRDIVRNSTLLNLPPWYVAGLVKYMSEGWTSHSDNLMYDDIKNDRFSSFNRLTGDEAARAGHALWYNIVGTYGEALIPNLLYMTRVTRSPDNAFIFQLGISLQNLIYDFTDAYNFSLDFDSPTEITNCSGFLNKINNSHFELESEIVKNSETNYLVKVKLMLKDRKLPLEKVDLLTELLGALETINGYSLALVRSKP